MALLIGSPLNMDSPKQEIKPEPVYRDGSVFEGSQSQYDTDDAYLKSLGKSAELHRVYNFWTCNSPDISPTLSETDKRTVCAYQVMISATWTCVVVLMSVVQPHFSTAPSSSPSAKLYSWPPSPNTVVSGHCWWPAVLRAKARYRKV